MLRRPLLLAALAAPMVARAQGTYPTRPVNFIIPFAPGGGTDIIARALQPTLQEEFGQALAIENRAGASGTLGIGQVTRSRPDGYTMAMTTVSASAVVPPLMNPPPYDILRDQTPVILAGTVPLVVVVPNSSPVRDFQGFLAHARANPGKLNYSSSGVATQQHLAAELLSSQAGLSMVHVPFRGTGQAVTEVLAGRIDIAMDTLPTYLPHIRAGRVRAIAVTMPQRVEWLPDLPTVDESGFPGFNANVWYMIIGPGGLPESVTERWVATTNRALVDPTARARLRESGFIVGGGSSADAAALLRRDAERYARVIREARIKLD
ncbi:Bug family tripartite tricarboxylate transporter substrate binding protein [Sabulicella rubraurantiaca]|uniref:Bug family tripartite tricarboxylate transporter substrate binding protein n=1 Tax=Sabulicella rubraurantiaca TaxID=2811429 RepID=UPI001A97835D|nr:tripartite tricarboxylate transporter substrate binding protein [Sabulicella rubraurantiaca]